MTFEVLRLEHITKDIHTDRKRGEKKTAKPGGENCQGSHKKTGGMWLQKPVRVTISRKKE